MERAIAIVIQAMLGIYSNPATRRTPRKVLAVKTKLIYEQPAGRAEKINA
jgi:hypothetical protein